jgi:hypothetical protein
MHYLGLALYAEGPTDYYFLTPLLLRLCQDICVREANQPVEMSEEVIPLSEPPSLKRMPREERILSAAKLARGAWSIVFIHTDGEGDPVRVRAERAQPAIDRLWHDCRNDGIGVAVIPIRETEAWALADGDAIRRIFGTTLDDAQLGLPRLALVESSPDPKATLKSAWMATNPPVRKRRQGISPLLNALGDSVSLECLRQLSGFRALETELRQALQALNILR